MNFIGFWVLCLFLFWLWVLMGLENEDLQIRVKA